MAKAATVPATKAKTEVAAPAPGADLFAYAGLGLEDTTRDDYAIPFIGALQKGSPQVDEASGVAIAGAKAGMFFNSVTGEMFDGKTGVQIVPVAYRRTFIHWGARGSDSGGFKGEVAPEEVEALRERGEVKELEGKLFYPMADGSINEKKSDRLSDTRCWYVLVLNEDRTAWTTALMSLTSTQIKKSKTLLSMLQSVKIPHPAGGMRTPPLFWNVVRATSVPESNDKGNWYGVRFELDGNTNGRAQLHTEAIAFAQAVRSGAITAKFEEEPSGAAGGNGEKF